MDLTINKTVCALSVTMLVLAGMLHPAWGSFTFTFPDDPGSQAPHYKDTNLYDVFPKRAGFVSAISSTNATTLNGPMTYTISGGTLSGSGETQTSTLTTTAYTLTLYTQTGAYLFAPDDLFFNKNEGIPNGWPGGYDPPADSGAVPQAVRITGSVIAKDSVNASSSATIFTVARLGGYNDNPDHVPGAQTAGTTVAGVGTTFMFTIPAESLFRQVDDGNLGDTVNILDYSAFIGSDESLFTSTADMDTRTENNIHATTWTTLLSNVGLSFSSTPTTLTLSGTPTRAGIIDVMIVATDSPANTYSVKRHTGTHVVVYVGTPAEDPPHVTSKTAVRIPENSTAVMTVTSLDPDPGATAAYSIAGGANQALFTIDTETGVLTFKAAPDFEAPADADGNNIYLVTVRVTDNSGLYAETSIAVTVTDVNEFTPVITSNGGGATAAVNVASGASAVTTVTASDTDGSAKMTYYVGGKDMARFSIDDQSGLLAFKNLPDISVPADAGGNNVYDILVMAFDGDFFDIQAIAVTVSVVNSMKSLTVAFAGDGEGSVNSVPGGIHCSSGSSCLPAHFATGGGVTLTPSPSAGSGFGSWSQNCTLTGNDCGITLNTDAAVTVTFDSLRWIRNSSAPAIFYGTLQSAYAAAADLDIIQLKSTAVLNEELVLDRGVKVVLEGGNDGIWNSSGFTALHGSLRVRSGSVTAAGIYILP